LRVSLDYRAVVAQITLDLIRIDRELRGVRDEVPEVVREHILGLRVGERVVCSLRLISSVHGRRAIESLLKALLRSLLLLDQVLQRLKLRR